MPRAAPFSRTAKLSPIDSVDFCGACHGTWWDLKLSGAKGVATVKSQPYRLESSKCWGKGDGRLTCIACHDPHQQLRVEPSSYDAVCLNGHVASTADKPTTNRPGAGCSVDTKNCVSSHMPTVYVPEMHYKFADHRIRIARPGDTYPE